MKRTLVLTLGVLMGLNVSMSAQRWLDLGSGNLKHQSATISPTRSIAYDDNGTTVTYNISHVKEFVSPDSFGETIWEINYRSSNNNDNFINNLKSIYTIGEALDAAIAYSSSWLKESTYHQKSLEEQRVEFHNFGDPSLRMITSAPQKFFISRVTRNAAGIIVPVNMAGAVISVYDGNNNTVTQYYSKSGESFRYETPNQAKVSFSVTHPGYVPYVNLGAQSGIEF